MDILKPVKAQLESYNNRDIEKFILNFSENCTVEDGEGNLLLKGRDEMYESYKKMFNESPSLFCDLQSRIVVGNYVLDEEKVTGRGGNEGISHVVAIYLVEDGEITKVRFLR